MKDKLEEQFAESDTLMRNIRSKFRGNYADAVKIARITIEKGVE